jgi:hypothetical protein
MKKIYLRNVDKFFTISAQDFKVVKKYRWHDKRGYVNTTVGKKGLLVHRLILKAVKGQEVDHRDGNPHNNTRRNLRLVTRSQNQMNKIVKNNKLGFKGVVLRRWGKWERYVAAIQVNKKKIQIGYFKTLEEASSAYRKAAKKYFKQFDVHNRLQCNIKTTSR